MIEVLVLFGIGILIGWGIRNRPNIIKLNDKLVTWAIFLLLFLLGINVGTNEKIINNLSTIGVQSLLLTLAAMVGSVILAFLLYKFIFRSSRGEL